MSDTSITLTDTVGPAAVSTTMAPEGDRWLTVVNGGVNHGFQAAMDAAGDPHVQHAQVIEFVKIYDAAVPPDGGSTP